MSEKNRKVHIVAFDIPFPPNYGGVIDIYYKCKYLHRLGVEIELHCFEYGRARSVEMERYCKRIHYYKRKRYLNPYASNLPYIVRSRISEELLENLNADEAPILLEGLHTTWVLFSGKVSPERCFVRTHNIEHEYYQRLEAVEPNSFKRLFFKKESMNLLAYESVLKRANAVFAISPFDRDHFAQVNPRTHLVTAFHESDRLSCQKGQGEYVLYHGNLAVGENNHAACYLASEVFPHIGMRAIIAGNKPGKKLRTLCAEHGIELIENTKNKEIIQLVENAHINVLPTFQKTGIKLKLLNALFKGRHCVVNAPMVEDTGLEPLCYIGNQAEDLIELINQLETVSFEKKEMEHRERVLYARFSNETNAALLAKHMDPQLLPDVESADN